MTPQTFLRCAVAPALSLLPPALDTPPARQMLLAIGLQESGLRHRQQIRGPARGYLQFELGGLQGVLKHDASSALAASVVAALDYDRLSPADVHAVLAHNDVLAAAMGRLLLWTHPKALPTDLQDGWIYYMNLWRPGKPHPGRWATCWAEARELL